jgi:hypothetical protein
MSSAEFADNSAVFHKQLEFKQINNKSNSPLQEILDQETLF